jgi:molybdate transport system regulatory protein
MKKPPHPLMEARFRLTDGRRFAFGPGQAALLDHLKQAGSIADAAKGMGMSYMRAWMLVKNMNRGFINPLVETVRGGRARGGAKLTATGGRVLQLYREIEAQSLQATRANQRKLARLLRP